MALDPEAQVTISHPDTPRRPFFTGPLKDALRKIEEEFPRHSHDGNGGQIMSAQINHADGGVSTYHDGTWTHPDEPEAEPVAEPVAIEPVSPAETPAFDFNAPVA